MHANAENMNRYINLWIFIILLIGLSSCSDEVDFDETPSVPDNEYFEINDFIWGGLNTWYLWQENVPNLADDRFVTQQAYNDFLQSAPRPEEFFESLLYNPLSVDVYSWIVDDYNDLENFLNQTSNSNGVDFQLVRYSSASDEIFGYVRLILPDSDASGKNIKRGDLFTAVNDIPLTVDNYMELLFNNDTYTLTLATLEGNTITTTGEVVELTKTEYVENNVHTTSIIEEGGKKIGYIHYTFFSDASESKLNEAFLTFKNENITNLVLDLRYNPGGYGYVARSLSSMITGQFTDELFIMDQFNSKIQPIYEEAGESYYLDRFVEKTSIGEEINSLKLNEVHIITTDRSASASEVVIVGLSPYIDVTVVGERTFGKYTGSYTLYDSPHFTKKDVNPNHTYAMQPIVLKYVNKNGESPAGGLEPDLYQTEDISNLGVIGDSNEPMLRTAINDILGISAKTEFGKVQEYEKVFDPRSNEKINHSVFKTNPEFLEKASKIRSLK